MSAQRALYIEKTRSTAADLAERTIHRRAVEAVIWGMPAVNYDLMYQAMVREAKGAFNQIAYWSRLPDWKIQTLTPNPDAIYLTPFTNTEDVDPVVLEIPPPMRVRSPAPSWMSGNGPWRTLGRRAWTRARAASTSSCHRATRATRRQATSPCHRTRTRATPCCAPFRKWQRG